jgi:transcriptional regulator with XRE-family HTH domain
MQIATRIRQVRIEHMLSLEDLAAKAGLSRGLLCNFENGQEIPSLEMLDRLAKAAGVSVQGLFCSDLDSMLTPRLTPRLTLQELVGESRPSAPDSQTLKNNAQTTPESPSTSSTRE